MEVKVEISVVAIDGVAELLVITIVKAEVNLVHEPVHFKNRGRI